MSNNVLSRWDSDAEKLVYRLLENYIDLEHYSIDVHVNLDRVFPSLHRVDSFKEEYYDFCDFICRSDMKDRIKFDKMHFDFVIYEKKHDLPILIIEVNGKSHFLYEKKHIDHFKNFIANKFDIPLKTLELYNQYSDQDVELLLSLLLNNVSMPGNHPVYCQDCSTRLKYVQRKDKSSFFYECPSCKRANGKHRTYSIDEIPRFFTLPFC